MSDFTATLNSALDPVLHQVIGSTPASIADSIKNTRIRGNAEIGSGLAAVAIYSATVNKATMESYLIKPEFSQVRAIVSAAMSISGKPNMTALTLLGHSIMTTDAVDGINYVKEFRNKMGQKDIWAGNLDRGSLSEAQVKILKEKVRITREEDAKLLGSGFFKFIGVDTKAMTAKEREFWGEPEVIMKSPTNIVRRARPPPAPVTPRRESKSPDSPSKYYSYVLSPTEEVEVSKKAYDYYMGITGGDEVKLKASIRKHGIAEFNSKFESYADKDPKMEGKSVGTVA